MARVTVEDCVKIVESRFELILIATERARLLSKGAQPLLDRDRDKNPVDAIIKISTHRDKNALSAQRRIGSHLTGVVKPPFGRLSSDHRCCR